LLAFEIPPTGSSARKLRRSGVNLLGGRALRRIMYPLTPVEMGSDFKLGAALRFGTLPLVLQAGSAADTLTAYMQMYLKEEIQAEALVRNLAGFSRFLPVAALFHGQVLNLANVARDDGITRSTARGFFEILEDTLRKVTGSHTARLVECASKTWAGYAKELARERAQWDG